MGAELFHELEGNLDTFLSVFDRLTTVIPGAERRADTERIGQRIAESVPVNHGEAQMIPHGLAGDDFVLVVPLEG